MAKLCASRHRKWGRLCIYGFLGTSFSIANVASVLFELQPFADVHLLIVYFSLVCSHLNYSILNWATANWSSIADLVKMQ